MHSRSKTLAVITALVTLSTTAAAQTYAFSRTELGRIVPARFATTTQQLLASADAAISMPIVAEEATNERVDFIKESMPSDFWGGMPLHESDTEGDEEKDANVQPTGFFSSTMGRASMLGLAGLAGASYFALRGESGSNVFPTVGSTSDSKAGTALPGTPQSLPAFPTADAPEPATIVLTAFGLGALGVIARRRKAA
jgi:hypothetical protein